MAIKLESVKYKLVVFYKEFTIRQKCSVGNEVLENDVQIAGQSIFEIGQRLKHVKENDLTHGEFGKWLKDHVNFTERQARRFMQVVDEFKTDDVVRIGSSKIFEVLQLPQEVDRQQFIEQPHIIPSTGEQKTVDEMTVREVKTNRICRRRIFAPKFSGVKLQESQRELEQSRKTDKVAMKQLKSLKMLVRTQN
ncbi:DUF3102 domain-containing protein [Bacillus cereus group sp. BfR-BA-01430]|uniref:DUF3102 domain-containing protein n=1 Tax=Bacillus cereus group sp. BfR-BA-01430 TaxID=2920346 RepID=UPI001F57D5D9|nr:DUF3102 domain-containing protein [Bacillus cereus group sp. BfR-BA-01430]